MTPDELRRMDNDLCIIFEKGIRPVKAQKYYYFKKPEAREMAACEISHNEFDAGVRGTWNKFNPYNPSKTAEDKEPDLKIESLDDLFDDDFDAGEPKPEQNPMNNNMTPEPPPRNIEEPMLPMENNTDDDDKYNRDLQKELEAKFDELFGPMDDDDNE